MCFPERSLEPPEDREVGKCAVCGGEIYAGEEHWSDGTERICDRHLDRMTAQHFGFYKSDGEES